MPVRQRNRQTRSRDRTARNAAVARETLGTDGPRRSGDSAPSDRTRWAKAVYHAIGHYETRLGRPCPPDGVPRLNSQVPVSNRSRVHAHGNGLRSSNIVGINSETVG